MKTVDFAQVINDLFPFSLQESYDNSGIILDFDSVITKAIVTLDINLAVVLEAVDCGANLIISHHPIIFSGVKKMSVKNLNDQALLKAIEHKISIIAVHTNIDNSIDGVNGAIAKKMGLQKCSILRPMTNQLLKLATYVPIESADIVRDALFEFGAGNIGNYSNCSFNIEGEGTFKANFNATPFVGEKNKLHFEPEIKIETIIPDYLVSKAIVKLKSVHPYEEVAYDLFPLKNANPIAGAGIVGELEKSMDIQEFLELVKSIFKLTLIRCNKIQNMKVKKIAFCGGSGSFLIRDAIAQKVDVFITGDIKYHDFFDAQGGIILADIGHFESEQHTIDIIIDVLIKKIPNFAILKTKIQSNPITYFI